MDVAHGYSNSLNYKLQKGKRETEIVHEHDTPTLNSLRISVLES
jgi:hypothetical protein